MHQCKKCGYEWNWQGKTNTIRCPKCKFAERVKKGLKKDPEKKISKDPKQDPGSPDFDLLAGIEGFQPEPEGSGSIEDTFFDFAERKADKKGDQPVISREEWLDLVNTLEGEEYGELYAMINDGLNEFLKTDLYKMSEKRKRILGKLTKKVLTLYYLKIKPIHLLGLALAFCYIPPTIMLAKEKKIEKDREYQRLVSEKRRQEQFEEQKRIEQSREFLRTKREKTKKTKRIPDKKKVKKSQGK